MHVVSSVSVYNQGRVRCMHLHAGVRNVLPQRFGRFLCADVILTVSGRPTATDTLMSGYSAAQPCVWLRSCATKDLRSAVPEPIERHLMPPAEFTPVADPGRDATRSGRHQRSIARATASAVRCRGLSVHFTTGRGKSRRTIAAVNDVNLRLAAGQITALIGPSGCGKTTLLRAMAGLQSPAEGGVVLEPVSRSTRGEIAFVFQQPALLPWRTTLQNVMLPLRLTGCCPRSENVHRAVAMLETVGLADSLQRMPHQLSGGMQMRVSIARALATDPSLLLLDEPFAALDDMLRNRLGELLLRLWRERRRTMVLVTHNIGEAVLLSHRVVVMRHGRLVGEVPITLPEPRDESLRRSPAFGTLYGRVGDLLRGGADA